MVAFVGKTNTDEDNGLKLILGSYMHKIHKSSRHIVKYHITL